MNSKNSKKFFSVLLVCTLMLSFFALSVLAADDTTAPDAETVSQAASDVSEDTPSEDEVYDAVLFAAASESGPADVEPREITDAPEEQTAADSASADAGDLAAYNSGVVADEGEVVAYDNALDGDETLEITAEGAADAGMSTALKILCVLVPLLAVVLIVLIVIIVKRNKSKEN